MKYFNPNYWFKLWLLITPLFNNQLQNTNAKAIYNKENIKDWKTKNISITDCTQSNDQDITCIHEAGHTTIILDSQYLGRTISDQFIPLNQIKNISDNDLYTLLRIDLAGFAAESMFFDSNPLKYIIGQARIIDSSDLQHYHNIYQEEFESKKLKPYNEEPLNFIGKQLNETRKIINNKLEFEKILKTCCLINYVNKNHTDYILKHKKIPIPLFKEEEIEKLTKTQIQTLTNEQIQALTQEQIPTIKPEQIAAFTKTQIQTLTTEQITALTKEQIPKFAIEQIQALTKEQIITFTEIQIPEFTEKQIKNFWWYQIQFFTEKQIPAFTEIKIPTFTTKQIKKFWWYQVQSFTEKQIQAFTKEQIQAFTTTQIPHFTIQQIPFFTNLQITWLTTQQIQAFTVWQITWFTKNKYLHFFDHIKSKHLQKNKLVHLLKDKYQHFDQNKC